MDEEERRLNLAKSAIRALAALIGALLQGRQMNKHDVDDLFGPVCQVYEEVRDEATD